MILNTNAAAVLAFDALTRCVCGSYDTAIEHAEKALQLSPLEPLVYHAAFGARSVDPERTVQRRNAGVVSSRPLSSGGRIRLREPTLRTS